MLRIDRTVDVLVRLYSESVAQLEALISRALASGALGTARYRRAQLAEATRILSELQDKAIPEATHAVMNGYREGTEIAEGGAIKGAFSGIHQDAVDVLADALSTKLNGAATNVGRQVDDIFRREGLRISVLSLIEGQTQREATKGLAESLRAQGVSGFEDRRGRLWRLDTYAEMATRTTTREAASEGTKNRLLEKGIDAVQISSHRHKHDVCDAYDGKRFSLTGKTKGLPLLNRLPPFHPNCVHVLTPA